MQGKYATSFILHKAPRIPLEVGSEGNTKICLGEKTYTKSDVRVPYEELKFSFEKLQNLRYETYEEREI